MGCLRGDPSLCLVSPYFKGEFKPVPANQLKTPFSAVPLEVGMGKALFLNGSRWHVALPLLHSTSLLPGKDTQVSTGNNFAQVGGVPGHSPHPGFQLRVPIHREIWLLLSAPPCITRRPVLLVPWFLAKQFLRETSTAPWFVCYFINLLFSINKHR